MHALVRVSAVVVVLMVLASAATGGELPELVIGEDVPPDGWLPVGGGDGSNFAPDLPDYGLTDSIVYNIPGFAFSNLGDAQHGRVSPGNYIYHSGGTSVFYDATFHLPSGALLYGVTPYIYDADANSNINVTIYRLDYHGYPPAPSSTNIFSVSSGGSSGYWFFYTALQTPEVIRNGYPPTFSNYYYLVVVTINPSGSTFDLTFGGVTLWYKLQASSAPATATFSDVPTDHPFFQHVEALADSGITAGCGSGTFCPDSPVTRGQMAVFLTKALGLHWAY